MGRGRDSRVTRCLFFGNTSWQNMKFQGLYTAMVTPFRGGKVDREAFRANIETQVAAGVTGIMPIGTTGESPTLSVAEHLEVIQLAVESVNGRIQVIAGAGANCTAEAIELAVEAEQVGVTGTLQVCPYYNKPSQEGVYRHFCTIAEKTTKPIVLYSIPGRCGIEIAVETVARLARDNNHIVAVKEAGGSVDRVNQLLQVLPDSFSILCGDDGLCLPFMSCGAVGLVSVTSNLVPDVMNRLVQACLHHDYAEALAIQKKYYPLMKGLMSLDCNPVPIKAAMAMRGGMTDELRLPLVELSHEKKETLASLMTQFKLNS
ncbi:MAG: 4-hydroxy-tetrahydrodipicolinate synthase [Akkermansia sp.]